MREALDPANARPEPQPCAGTNPFPPVLPSAWMAIWMQPKEYCRVLIRCGETGRRPVHGMRRSGISGQKAAASDSAVQVGISGTLDGGVMRARSGTGPVLVIVPAVVVVVVIVMVGGTGPVIVAVMMVAARGQDDGGRCRKNSYYFNFHIQRVRPLWT
ncbi:MAG: hypothetical protein E7K14_05005 [Bacillota bacterium]|nr:hypothetical protein [Bacillota bacterium]